MGLGIVNLSTVIVRLFWMNRFFVFLFLGLMVMGFVSGAGDADFSGRDKIRMIVRGPVMANGNSRMVSVSNAPIADVMIKSDLGDRLSVEASLGGLEELKALGFEILGEDKLVHTFLQDAVGIVNANVVWGLNVSERSVDGSNVAVCVIDTGADVTHPDLAGKVIGEYCFCSTNEGNDPSCCPDGTSEDGNATDNNGHGTHVAGIIAASGGIDGVARGANIVAVKVLNSSGVGSSSDIRLGIEWCTNDTQVNAYNISVISLSLGGGQYDNSADCIFADSAGIGTAINAAWAKNISVVVATGNGDPVNATLGISSPACLGNTTKVTASDKLDNYASYAFRHSAFADILVAVGGVSGNQINSTCISGDVGEINGYCPKIGTSMSAPMVSGAIALMKQYLVLSSQTKTPTEISSILNSTGIVLDDSAGSGYNFSRIDAYSALLSLDNIAPNVTLVSPADNNINISQNQTFVCNATDWQLANVTLEVWNSSGLYYNVSENLTGAANESSFDLTEMPLGNYEWNCFVVDDLGNSAFASANYSLTIGGIELTMVSPANNTYTNVNETNFTCTSISEENYELSNVTFYLWNSSGELIYNSTENISGFSNESIFNWTFIVEDSYDWKCVAVNNNSNESVDGNYTLTYDATFPELVLAGDLPTSATSNSVSKSFSFNISDDNIANCSLILNAVISQTNSSMNTSITQAFTQTLTPDTYNWQINCSDYAGNVNSSSVNSFVVTAEADEDIGGGGGGGGGGGITTASSENETSVYLASASDVSRGYSKSLKKNEKVNFSFFGNGGERHLLVANEVGVDHVNFTVMSDPINFTLGIGQSIKLNLSSVDRYDLMVKLDGISGGVANVTIQSIDEAIEPEVVVEKEIVEKEIVVIKDYIWVVIVLVVILVGIVFVVIKVNRKKLKGFDNKDKKDNGKNKKAKA